MVFHETPPGIERRRSGFALAKLMLRAGPEILLEHRKEVLHTAIWKITECEGKWNTRFKSVIALHGKPWRHEHVYQRAKMVEALLRANPEDVDAILEKAVGCVVTIDEHLRLDEWDHLDGWARYEKAGIAVMDMATGTQWISLP
jgi:hypothetical protein